ncbi:YihY/virulence factor BrkB family protein [Brachybacterium horti]
MAAEQREYVRPRLTIWHVLNRVRMRLLDIQVWDVAGTMTFYTLLSLFPGAVAAVSLMSMLGIEQEPLDAAAVAIREIFPTFDPDPFVDAIIAVSTTNGGVIGLVVGTAGSLVSASNGVAAFHRALHRVYDTREGRPFLWFRTIVFGETVVIVTLVLLALGILVIGNEASQALGEIVGIPRFAFEAWNLVKWPILLVLLVIGVSMAYYLFPNVRLPRYRLMTLGSTVSVLVLFGAALLAGRLAALVTSFAEVLTVLNGLIGILLLLWVANIVIVAGAALDAEFLRARQIAAGLDAWHTIVLDPHATHTLDFLAQDAEQAEAIGREVAIAARTGEPLTRARSAWVAESTAITAVNPPQHHRITSTDAEDPREGIGQSTPGDPAA